MKYNIDVPICRIDNASIKDVVDVLTQLNKINFVEWLNENYTPFEIYTLMVDGGDEIGSDILDNDYYEYITNLIHDGYFQGISEVDDGTD